MGNPVIHWELWSKDPQGVSAFYEKVFDWKINHVPELNYRIVDTEAGSGINGGIMQPQEGPWPGNMSFYIAVDDLGSYRKRITDAAGRSLSRSRKCPGWDRFRYSRIRTVA